MRWVGRKEQSDNGICSPQAWIKSDSSGSIWELSSGRSALNVPGSDRRCSTEPSNMYTEKNKQTHENGTAWRACIAENENGVQDSESFCVAHSCEEDVYFWGCHVIVYGTPIREICAMNGRTRQDAHTAVAEARLGVCFAYRLLSLDDSSLTNKNKITLLRDSPGDFSELLFR